MSSKPLLADVVLLTRTHTAHRCRHPPERDY